MSEYSNYFDTISRWGFVFETLSLCSAEPFFDDMGLAIASSPELREIARQYVRDWEIPGRSKEAALDAALHQLTTVLGSATAEKILDWERHSHDHYSDEWHLTGSWDSLFKTAFDDNFHGSRLEPPTLDRHIHRALRSIITQYRLRYYAIRDKFDQHQAAIESEVHAIWGDPIPAYGPDYYSPISWMSLQAMFVVTMELWKQLQAVLSDEARLTLQAWGEEQGRKYYLLEAHESLPLIQPPSER